MQSHANDAFHLHMIGSCPDFAVRLSQSYPRSAFTNADVGKKVLIQGDRVFIGNGWVPHNLKPRYINWTDAKHHDCSGIIKSVEEKYKGNVQLESGQEFENGAISPKLHSISSEGVLEIFLNSSWHPVCAHGFDHRAATTVCRKLGFQKAEKLSNNEVTMDKNAFQMGLCGAGQWGLKNRCTGGSNYYEFVTIAGDCRDGVLVECFGGNEGKAEECSQPKGGTGLCLCRW